VKALPTARTAVPAALVLGAALALTACGPQQAGAAAIVGDRVISDQDVQTAAQETNKAVEGLNTKLSSSDTLVSLILAPYVLDAAARDGHGVSDSQARQVLSKLANPSPATLDFVKTQIAIQNLTAADQQSILDKLAKEKITVNPRYGTFDAKKLQLDRTTEPNWIKARPATATPTPTAGQ
jgi:hypothetical protein